MGSVMREIPCPQCKKYPAMSDVYLNSGEVYENCGVCGYHYREWIEYDKEALKSGSESGLLPSYDGAGGEGCLPWKRMTEEILGFGSCYIKYRERDGKHFWYPIPITQELIDMFMEKISSPEVDRSKCYLVRWNTEAREIEFVYGREELLVDLFGMGIRLNNIVEESCEKVDDEVLPDDVVPF